jgi:hypothetical protein
MTLVGSGTIGPGSAEYYDVTLTAARPHRVYVHPDDPTVDFDLYVYDQNGNPITQDVSTSSDAYCIITPLWTGPFRVVVKSAAGASSYKITVEE